MSASTVRRSAPHGRNPMGQPFNGGSVFLVPSETVGGVLVRVTISEPRMVFAMTPEQAVEFGNDLAKTGKVAQRHNNPQQSPAPDERNFTTTTITDNVDVLVQRMVYK